MKLKLQGEIDESAIIAGDFNTPLSKMADSAGRKSVRTQMSSITSPINRI